MDSILPFKIPDNEGPVSALNHLSDVRYMAVVGLTVLVYDRFLTFNAENDVIWASRRWSLSNIIFVFYRYSAILWSALYLAFLIPVTAYSSLWCNNVGISLIVLDEIVETIGNGIVFYELIVLWGSIRRMSYMMAGGFFLVHSMTLLSVVLTVTEVQGKFFFLNLDSVKIRMCVTTVSPVAYKGIYIPAVVLHVYAFFLLLLNAVARPRSSSQKLLDLLWGDGLVFFLVSLGMRLMCLILNLAAPASLGVLGFGLSSGVVNAAVSRLYLQVNNPRGAFKSHTQDIAYGEADWTDEDTELQVRNRPTSA